ncbi:MAG: hypothetical protein WBX11_11420 [Thiobacillaceae bacterium]
MNLNDPLTHAPDAPAREPRTLPRTLRQRVNHLSHEAGLKHEADLRDRLMKHLTALAANGVSVEDQHRYLDNLLTGKTK